MCATRRLAVLLLLAACGGDDPAAAPGAEPGAGEPGTAQPGAGAAAPLAGQDCLVILLDALHAERLGCYGAQREVSPHIDALAAQGVRCAQARSNSSWTLPSTTTLFTGLYQETHGLHFDREFESLRLDPAVDTLAELFAEAGYDTAFLNQNPLGGVGYGLEQGFADYREFNEFRQSVDAVAVAAVERLRAPRTRPRFTYVHFRKPHTPFDAPEDERARFVDPDYAGPAAGTEAQISDHNTGRTTLAADDLRHHANLYDANIHQVDGWVGRLAAEADERTLVLLLSDHGEAVGQHGMLGHNWHSYEEYVHIPLLFRHPAFGAGRVLQSHVSTVDLLPTLSELFGLRAPAQGVQGRSFAPLLLQPDAAWEERPVFTSSRLLNGRRDLAVIDGDWKYIRTEPGAREQLFDLRADPGETRNLVSEAPRELVVRLRGELAAWLGPQRRTWAVPGPVLDDEALERLRQLGYIR